MKHCADLFALASEAALLERDLELAIFCQDWLSARRPLVEEAQRQLGWFASHPGFALEHAT